MSVIELDSRVSYIPATEDPLSADVGIIRADSRVWLFDVGSSGQALADIEAIPGEKSAVLSHFHPDHTGNLERLPDAECYAGEFTVRRLGRGTAVSSELTVEDGVRLRIFPLPSTHAKGSLGLEVDGKYAFLGDGTYAAKKDGRIAYNAQLLFEQIRLLKALRAEYFLLSHSPGLVHEKAEVVGQLEEILSLRRNGEPYIFV